MAHNRSYTRPPYEEALAAWHSLLKQHGPPAECSWVFDENLCFEKDSAAADGFRLGFQTRFTPPPPDAERIAYDHFAESEARLVFYRIGSCRGKSISLLLCDPWFEGKQSADGFNRRDEWLMSFYPGSSREVEEIVDRSRWENRILRDRPLHDLDFCMTLRAIHETLAHGRVLTAYERYALQLLSSWRRIFASAD